MLKEEKGLLLLGLPCYKIEVFTKTNFIVMKLLISKVR